MLKIYRAFEYYGEIKLEDYIKFSFGRFDTGLNGFGIVKAGHYNCTLANYELQKLKYYRSYLQSIKCVDGYVENFEICNPYNYEVLEHKYMDIPKNFDTYEEYGLNEEAIILFTDRVRLSYSSTEPIERIFGRYPENGMYLIMPNASFDMIADSFSSDIKENCELLQSRTLGKRLVLQIMDRKI